MSDDFDGPNAQPSVPLARRIAEIARLQGGHVTSEQLRELGLSRRAIQHRAAQGTLIRAHHGVYAVGHLPTHPLDRARAALLAAGPRSAIADDCALAFWRRDSTWPRRLQLISATDRRPRGVSVRHSTTLLKRDIRVVNGVRVTSPARTALDIAPHVTMNRLTRIVDELRHDNGLKIHQLRDVANRNPRHPGANRIKQLIGDSQREHTRSELENAFRRLIKKYKLPEPQINVHVAGHRVDAYFPDHRLVIELDGGVTHGNDWKPAFEQDRATTVDIMVKTGLPVIRFTWDQITRLRSQTAEKLERILAARAQQPRVDQPNRR